MSRWFTIAVLVGCSGGEASDSEETGAGGPDPTNPDPTMPWSFTELDDQDGGLQLRLVAEASGAWAAWFVNQPTIDGICEEVDVAPPPRERFPLRVARVTPDGA
ncbi:MAG: hypothetical protein AAF602_33440, partial [Myxococcota bacterium]